MAAPLGHATVGACIFAGMRKALLGPRAGQKLANVLLFGAAIFLSLLPDADSAFGILFGDFGKYHNNLSHSLFVGLAVAVVAGAIVSWLTKARYRLGFLFALLCYELHVLVDYFTFGRGVMLFWPITSARFQAPFKIFYGLHWSYGVWHPAHLLTLANELSFAALLVLVYELFRRIRARKTAEHRA